MKKKGQLKIQQMAFVLVALMIFFAMVGIIFFSIYLSELREDVQDLRDREARELVRKLSSSPEFTFNAESCASCVDFIKALKVREMGEYKKFWKLDYLVLEKINNKTKSNQKECDTTNIHECDKITIIGNDSYGSAKSSFVVIAWWDDRLLGGNGDYRYELGKIYASEIDI